MRVVETQRNTSRLEHADLVVVFRLSPVVLEELHQPVTTSHHVDSKTGSLIDVGLQLPFSRVNSHFAIASLMSQSFIGRH